MNRFARGMLSLLVPLMVAGCASTAPASSGSSSPSLNRLYSELVTTARSIHTLKATINVAKNTSGVGVSKVSAQVWMSGSHIKEVFQPSAGPAITMVNTGTQTLTLVGGGSRYSQSSTMIPTGFDVSWLTSQYLQFLQNVTFTAVKKTGKDLTIQYRGSLPSQQEGTGTLTIQEDTKEPVGLTVHTSGVTATLNVKSYKTNLTVLSSVFTVTPPTGAIAISADPLTLTALNQAASQVSFRVVTPTPKSNLTLTNVRVVAHSSYGPELLLLLTDSSGTPVLVTEFHAGQAPPMPASAIYSGTVDGAAVSETNITTGLYATVTLGKTTVIAEGAASDITAFLQNLPAGA